jgi:hypothetical protein
MASSRRANSIAREIDLLRTVCSDRELDISVPASRSWLRGDSAYIRQVLISPLVIHLGRPEVTMVCGCCAEEIPHLQSYGNIKDMSGVLPRTGVFSRRGPTTRPRASCSTGPCSPRIWAIAGESRIIRTRCAGSTSVRPERIRGPIGGRTSVRPGRIAVSGRHGRAEARGAARGGPSMEPKRLPIYTGYDSRKTSLSRSCVCASRRCVRRRVNAAKSPITPDAG